MGRNHALGVKYEFYKTKIVPSNKGELILGLDNKMKIYLIVKPSLEGIVESDSTTAYEPKNKVAELTYFDKASFQKLSYLLLTALNFNA